MNASTYKEPTNLKEFNQQLFALKLPMATADQMTAILNKEPRDRLVKALREGSKNTNAITYLKNVLNQAGVIMSEVGTQTEPVATENENNRQAQTTDKNAEIAAGSIEQSADSQNKEFIGHHVYGKSYAFYFRADKSQKNKHTIMIDAAKANGDRTVNWKDKICIQLTQEELPQVAAVFFGIIKKCGFSNHGPQHNKGFNVEHQGNKVFINLNEKGKPAHAIPITASDAFYVGNLFLRQLQLEQPWMSGTDILTTFRYTVGQMAAA